MPKDKRTYTHNLKAALGKMGRAGMRKGQLQKLTRDKKNK